MDWIDASVDRIDASVDWIDASVDWIDASVDWIDAALVVCSLDIYFLSAPANFYQAHPSTPYTETLKGTSCRCEAVCYKDHSKVQRWDLNRAHTFARQYKTIRRYVYLWPDHRWSR